MHRMCDVLLLILFGVYVCCGSFVFVLVPLIGALVLLLISFVC